MRRALVVGIAAVVLVGIAVAALALCRAALGREAPDCAQGAFHDYWLAVRGADEHCLRGAAQVDEPLATFS